MRTPMNGDWQTRRAPDGREFGAPLEGELDIDLFAALAENLSAHTATPDAGVAALWEGYGGLTGFFGQGPARVFFDFTDDPHHQAMLARSTRDPFNNGYRAPIWQEGILSREISEGPRLSLPGRDYLMFRAAPRAFADASWVLAAAWRDRPAEAHGFSPSAQHPNILWPEDRAWVMVSEIDFDSTIVAGPADLVSAICADARLEALPIPAEAELAWDSDRVNE